MLTYTLIVALVISSLLLFGLIFLYSFFLGKFMERDKDSYRKAEQALVEAHAKASLIVGEASEKAKRILSETEREKTQLEGELRQSMKDTLARGIKLLEDDTTEISKSYHQMYEEVKDAFLKQVRETLGKVQEAGELGLQEFKASLKDQQLTSQYYIEKRLNQEFDQAQKDVAKYKEEQLRRVEESIDKIILRLSSEILGRAISLEDHEKLVFEALNKAKEEGVFDR